MAELHSQAGLCHHGVLSVDREEIKYVYSCLWLVPLRWVPFTKHGLPGFVKSCAHPLASKEFIHMHMLGTEVLVFMS